MKYVGCTLKQLPDHLATAAARTACEINPANHPAGQRLARVAVGLGRESLRPEHLALLTSKWWGAGGVKLGVAFLDSPAADLKARILSHMNAWARTANVSFFEAAAGSAEVRITRDASGNWSYLGTDALHIPKGQATMNLQGFTMRTPESEFLRVVRHETGHTLGFPHEHLRRAIVQRLDPDKTIALFRRTQGWSADEVRQQVLTPLEEASLMAPTPADETSILAYEFPGSITLDGRPIPGGKDINASDYAYAARMYPRPDAPVPPPPPPPPGDVTVTIPRAGTYRLVG